MLAGGVRALLPLLLLSADAAGNPSLFVDGDEAAGKCSMPAPAYSATADLLLWGNRIIASSPENGSCGTVAITADKGTGSRKQSVAGVGTVFVASREPRKLFVLTAWHVLSNANRIEVECNGKRSLANVRGVDPVRDLAVVEISAMPVDVKPIFQWNGRRLLVPEILSELPVDDEEWIPKGRHLLQTVIPVSGKAEMVRIPVQAEVETAPSVHGLVGSKNAVLLRNHGIRPGMSGSPLLYETTQAVLSDPEDAAGKKVFLAGVLLRTVVNNSESVVVPVESISDALPALMSGQRAPLSFPFEFERHLATSDAGLIEYSEIVLKTKGGGSVIRSVCSGPYSESRSGQRSVEAGKAGEGDGSGGARTSGSYLLSEQVSLYRDHTGCRETGVRDDSGNEWIALRKKSGGLMRIESVHDLSEMLQDRPGEVLAELNERGIPASDADTMIGEFCGDATLFDSDGRPARVRMARHALKLGVAGASWNGEAIEASREALGGKKNRLRAIDVRCDKNAREILVKGSIAEITVDLKIRAREWSGSIRIGGCEERFGNIAKSPWSALLETDRMSLQMALSPDRDFLTLDILSVDGSCEQSGQPSRGFLSVSKEPATAWLSKVFLGFPAGAQERDDSPEDEESRTLRLIQEDSKIMSKVAGGDRRGRNVSAALAELRERRYQEMARSRHGGKVSQRRVQVLNLMISTLRQERGSK